MLSMSISISQYKESDFYEKYKDTYFSDVILRDIFKCELNPHRLYGLNKKTYEDVHQLIIDVMGDIIRLLAEKIDVEDKSIFWDMIYAFYLDPDSKAIKELGGIDCSADGLFSIKRIYRKYGLSERMISEYTRYRRVPIFFFPSEIGGINIRRYGSFGDRIDHTLLDLKIYLEAENEDKENECILLSAYKNPKTLKWLNSIKATKDPFKELVDWYGVKGSFVNEEYEVFDIENGGMLKEHGYNYNSREWSVPYYDNLKKCIDNFMGKND